MVFPILDILRKPSSGVDGVGPFIKLVGDMLMPRVLATPERHECRLDSWVSSL